MNVLSFIICLIIIAITAFLLYRKVNPQGVLLLAGILMVALAASIGINPVEVSKPTGSAFFDVFRFVEEKFVSNFTRAGLMIMIIGGYVALMNKIQATNMLVYIAIKPLSFLKKYPYLAAMLAIPIGQMLFITTPSATGVGLLLVATLYPILTNLGVSKLTALSVIAAATLFDQGPGSANTASAASLIGISPVEYFVSHQLPVVLPTTAILMVVLILYNRRCDRKDLAKGKAIYNTEMLDESGRPDVPGYFALLPLTPIALLLLFSDFVGIFDISFSTTVAMLVSLVIALVCVGCHERSAKKVFPLFVDFWKGMGGVFASVVSLIVCAEVFSGGLINLGFVDGLVHGSTTIGLGGVGISLVITAIVFLAAMLMGSGNAAFFSFGPLIPQIAGKLGMPAVEMILPLQLSASMGRAASPISGVIVAISGVAGVNALDLVKRNTIPLVFGAACLTAIHFFI